VAALSPSQLAALQAAAIDSRGQLQRTPDGYASDGAPRARFSSRAVYGLEKLGLVEYVEPGLQSLVHITDAGRNAVAGFARVARHLEVQGAA
jgi:hypothetical protein